MTLYDQIVDEAEELARNKVLEPYASRERIAEVLSDVLELRPPLGEYTTGAFLAEAAHNRQLRLDEARDKAIEQAEALIAVVEEMDD